MQVRPGGAAGGGGARAVAQRPAGELLDLVVGPAPGPEIARARRAALIPRPGVIKVRPPGRLPAGGLAAGPVTRLDVLADQGGGPVPGRAARMGARARRARVLPGGRPRPPGRPERSSPDGRPDTAVRYAAPAVTGSGRRATGRWPAGRLHVVEGAQRQDDRDPAGYAGRPWAAGGVAACSAGLAQAVGLGPAASLRLAVGVGLVIGLGPAASLRSAAAFAVGILGSASAFRPGRGTGSAPDSLHRKGHAAGIGEDDPPGRARVQGGHRG